MTASATIISEDDLKWVLGTSQGRRVIWDILAFSGLYKQPFRPGDNESTLVNCGALNVGLLLYADCLTVDPYLTAMMTKEQGDVANEPNTGNPSVDNTGSAEPEPESLEFNRFTGRGDPRLNDWGD